MILGLTGTRHREMNNVPWIDHNQNRNIYPFAPHSISLDHFIPFSPLIPNVIQSTLVSSV